MALLKCRECGMEISSETRQTRCKGCGTLFPFACAVCGKSLRPPFSIYPEERFMTADNQPLCEDHYQRQCPDCHNWFRADENPGFFRCPNCTHAREAVPAARPPRLATAGAGGSSPRTAAVAPLDEPGTPQSKKAGCAPAILGGLTLGGALAWEIGQRLLGA